MSSPSSPAPLTTASAAAADDGPRAGYIGLINQGCTCYLNSTVQVLYHLPYFRSSVYLISARKAAAEENKRSEDINDDDNDNTVAVPPSDSLCTPTKKSSSQPNSPHHRAITTMATSPGNPAAVDDISMLSAGEDTTDTVARALQELFFQLQERRTPAQTVALTRSFGWTGEDLFVQHDIHEMLTLFRESLENLMKGTPSENTINALFQGKGEHVIETMDKTFTSRKPDVFYDVHLPVVGHTNLLSSLRSLTAKDQLTGTNKYKIEKDGEDPVYKDAETGYRFVKFPPVMCFHLKRFEMDMMSPNLDMRKVNDYFEFEKTIDLTDFEQHDDGEGEGDKTIPKAFRGATRAIYDLHSVIVHHGTIENGHYYCYVRTNVGRKAQQGDAFQTKEKQKKQQNDSSSKKAAKKKKRRRLSSLDDSNLSESSDDEPSSDSFKSARSGSLTPSSSSSSSSSSDDGGNDNLSSHSDVEDEWLELDDDRVRFVPESTAVKSNFGGMVREYYQQRAYNTPSVKNAYMLTYVRRGHLPLIMKPTRTDIIPPRVKNELRRLMQEDEERLRLKQRLALQAQLWVVTDDVVYDYVRRHGAGVYGHNEYTGKIAPRALAAGAAPSSLPRPVPLYVECMKSDRFDTVYKMLSERTGLRADEIRLWRWKVGGSSSSVRGLAAASQLRLTDPLVSFHDSVQTVEEVLQSPHDGPSKGPLVACLYLEPPRSAILTRDLLTTFNALSQEALAQVNDNGQPAVRLEVSSKNPTIQRELSTCVGDKVEYLRFDPSPDPSAPEKARKKELLLLFVRPIAIVGAALKIFIPRGMHQTKLIVAVRAYATEEEAKKNGTQVGKFKTEQFDVGGYDFKHITTFIPAVDQQAEGPQSTPLASAIKISLLCSDLGYSLGLGVPAIIAENPQLVINSQTTTSPNKKRAEDDLKKRLVRELEPRHPIITESSLTLFVKTFRRQTTAPEALLFCGTITVESNLSIDSYRAQFLRMMAILPDSELLSNGSSNGTGGSVLQKGHSFLPPLDYFNEKDAITAAPLERIAPMSMLDLAHGDTIIVQLSTTTAMTAAPATNAKAAKHVDPASTASSTSSLEAAVGVVAVVPPAAPPAHFERPSDYLYHLSRQHMVSVRVASDPTQEVLVQCRMHLDWHLHQVADCIATHVNALFHAANSSKNNNNDESSFFSRASATGSNSGLAYLSSTNYSGGGGSDSDPFVDIDGEYLLLYPTAEDAFQAASDAIRSESSSGKATTLETLLTTARQYLAHDLFFSVSQIPRAEFEKCIHLSDVSVATATGTPLTAAPMRISLPPGATAAQLVKAAIQQGLAADATAAATASAAIENKKDKTATAAGPPSLTAMVKACDASVRWTILAVQAHRVIFFIENIELSPADDNDNNSSRSAATGGSHRVLNPMEFSNLSRYVVMPATPVPEGYWRLFLGHIDIPSEHYVRSAPLFGHPCPLVLPRHATYDDTMEQLKRMFPSFAAAIRDNGAYGLVMYTNAALTFQRDRTPMQSYFTHTANPLKPIPALLCVNHPRSRQDQAAASRSAHVEARLVIPATEAAATTAAAAAGGAGATASSSGTH